MKHYFFAALVTLVSTAAFAIDCSRARTPAEVAICTDPVLKAYDEFLDQAYSRVRSLVTAEAFAEVRRSQNQWIKARDQTCAADTTCMIEETQRRTAALNGFAQRHVDARVAPSQSQTPVLEGGRVSPVALSAADVYKVAANSVVVVHAYSSTQKGVSQGSGVVLSANMVATNCHVVEGAQQAAVFFRGERYEVVSANGDKAWDYCLLWTKNLPALPATVGAMAQVSPGQRVYTVGSPRGLELTIADGLVSGLRSREGMPLPLIQTSAAMSPGSSGGGLFDEYGRVIGITTFLLKESQSLNFALPVELATRLQRK